MRWYNVCMLGALAMWSVSAVMAAVDRNGFPTDFNWCAATAAYQIEGGAKEGGRGPSIWDTYSHQPGRIADNGTGDVACDSYHKYKQDVALLKSLHVKSYRFSISPSRILPTGRLPANPAGIAYYSKLLNELEKAHIQPMVTLYHWDLADALQKEEGGWLNRSSVQHFVDYARVVFEAFASRVPLWITFNEPWCSCWQGYGTPWKAPGLTKAPATDPYIASHHMLLAHAYTVKMYREQYAWRYRRPATQWMPGRIGITLNSDFAIPASTKPEDVAAANRYVEFMLGWYADPIYHGDYPASMRAAVGDRLPRFTPYERAILLGSNDFFGINAYTTLVAQNAPNGDGSVGWDNDKHVATSHQFLNGSNFGTPAASPWLFYTPSGLTGLLQWISERYGWPEIYITENGVSVPGEGQKDIAAGVLNDGFRVQYYRGYLQAMRAAMNKYVKVKAYCAWSLMDNFEWGDGYTNRFGMHYVDFAQGQTRTPKLSADFYAQVVQGKESLDKPSPKFQYTMPQ